MISGEEKRTRRGLLLIYDQRKARHAPFLCSSAREVQVVNQIPALGNWPGPEHRKLASGVAACALEVGKRRVYCVCVESKDEVVEKKDSVANGDNRRR